MARDALTGVLLVGGASRRFGSPKALAPLDGETFAERAWRILGEACSERIAVGKRADGLALPFPLVDDGTPVRAPIAGVVAGLRAARHDACIVLPVDCVRVTVSLLAELGAALAGHDAAVPASGPLPGAYRRSALPALQLALASDDLSLRSVLARLDTVTVDADPRLLVNVNTETELEGLS